MLAQPAWAQAPIVIKFSHVVAIDTPKGKASEFFAKKAAELTKGKVKVEVYANSTLYKDKEEMEALQLGAVQMLAPSLAKFGPLGVKEFEVFDLPFIFDNSAELHKVTQGPVGKQLLASSKPRASAARVLGQRLQVVSANKALKTAGRLPGLKMRIQSSKVLEAQMRAVGALPQVMAFSEVYQALQTGRRRRHREPALEPLHAEDARGAEVRHGVRPRLPRLRGDHQQEVLGRPARPTCWRRSSRR
jgi:C4-dicarboxylate-binding protein DctP